MKKYKCQRLQVTKCAKTLQQTAKVRKGRRVCTSYAYIADGICVLIYFYSFFHIRVCVDLSKGTPITKPHASLYLDLPQYILFASSLAHTKIFRRRKKHHCGPATFKQWKRRRQRGRNGLLVFRFRDELFWTRFFVSLDTSAARRVWNWGQTARLCWNQITTQCVHFISHKKSIKAVLARRYWRAARPGSKGHLPDLSQAESFYTVHSKQKYQH